MMADYSPQFRKLMIAVAATSALIGTPQTHRPAETGTRAAKPAGQTNPRIALCPQHNFLVLTKRPERMRVWSARRDERGWHPAMAQAALLAMTGRYNTPALDLTVWPLPNVWLGTSVEDQATANARIPHLLATPSAVRFISAEPLLGALDLTRIVLELSTAPERAKPDLTINALTGWHGGAGDPARLDWVIVGGESGPGARPMHPDWARSIRDQCEAAGVAFFFKQWGEWGSAKGQPGHLAIGHVFDDGYQMIRLGKARAGRLLDGREWNQMPGVADA